MRNLIAILLLVQFCAAAAISKQQCECKSEKTGKNYNFCYTDPQNETSIGMRFGCSSLKHLEDLELVNPPGDFVNTSIPTRNYLDVAFVSCALDWQFKQAQGSFQSIRKFYPNHTYILYDLGMLPEHRAIFEKYENVEVRTFNSSKYHEDAQIHPRRYKMIMIANALKTYPNVFYINPDVEVEQGGFLDILYKDRSLNNVPSDIQLIFYSSHSNFAVLDPTVLKYLPTNSMELLKSQDLGLQYEMKVMYTARTEESLKILKWQTLCALDQTCMNPPNATFNCQFTSNPYSDYANCFRYDQSIINLLLLNEYQDYRKYTSYVGYFFKKTYWTREN